MWWGAGGRRPGPQPGLSWEIEGIQGGGVLAQGCLFFFGGVEIDDNDDTMKMIMSKTMTSTALTTSMTIMMITTVTKAMAHFFFSQLRSGGRTGRESCNPGASAFLGSAKDD